MELDARGHVKVDGRLQTTASGLWAMGECAGSPQFTHVAFDDFRVVRDNLAGKARSTKDRLVPYCAFLDPQLGRVGLGEEEARRLGLAVRVVRLPMTSVLRARAIGETMGFMKALLDTKSDRILRGSRSSRSPPRSVLRRGESATTTTSAAFSRRGSRRVALSSTRRALPR